LQRASSEEKAFLEKVISALRRNINYNAEELASIVGIGRSTFFYRLQRLGIRLEEIRKALIYEVELKRKEKVHRKEVKRLPPSNFEEFLQREVVQKLRERLASAIGQITEGQAQKIPLNLLPVLLCAGISPRGRSGDSKNKPRANL